MKRKIKFIFLIIILISCNQKPINETSESEKSDTLLAPVSGPIIEVPKVEKSIATETKSIDLHTFSKEDVSKYAIASIMDQPPEIIKVKKEGELYLLSYTRKSDGEKFNYKIKFLANNVVVWGNSDGRWRDSVNDEKITYKEESNKLRIIQTFEDDSSIDRIFEKNK